MFWKRREYKEGPPTSIPAYVGKALVAEMQKLPQSSDHWVNYQMVIRPQAGKADTYDARVVDVWEFDKDKTKITDYAYLDTYPDMIKFEGWFNSKTHQVDMKARVPAEKPAEKPIEKPAQKAKP
jgi:hypothetical protein